MGTQKKKKKKLLQVTGSSISNSIITSRRRKSALKGITIGGSRIRSLINSHLLVHLLKVQVFQIYSIRVLNEISSQKLEPLEIPAEEHSVILFSLLETFDGLDSYRLNLLLGSQELPVLLQSQLSFSPEVVT